MRTLIPLILIAVSGYVGWYYWQVYTDRPLSEPLLLTTEESLVEIKITSYYEEAFRMFRADEFGWVVSQSGREVYDQSARVEELIDLLTGMQTDSVISRAPDMPVISVELVGADMQEEVAFYFQPDAPLLARIITTGDVFALPDRNAARLAGLLNFSTYRSKKLLKAAPESIDSIRLDYHDSLLWRPGPEEVGLLSKTFTAPAAAPYADYFDEITDREKYYATLKLYADGEPHRVEIYRDSLWPRPYVLIGEDFPRTYLAVDSLPIPAYGN